MNSRKPTAEFNVAALEAARRKIDESIGYRELIEATGVQEWALLDAVCLLKYGTQQEIDHVRRGGSLGKTTIELRKRKRLNGGYKRLPHPRAKLGALPIALPPGDESPTEVVRRGMRLEADEGISAEAAAIRVGIARPPYRIIRDVVRLLDRVDDLGADAEIVKAEAAKIDQYRTVRGVREAVEPIVERVWGSGKVRRTSKSEARLVERFETAITILAESSERARMLVIPYVDEPARARHVAEIKGAIANLRFLKSRIEQEETGS